MLRVIVKDGIRYLPYQYEDEDDLETMFRKHVDIIFGNVSLFFDASKIKSRSGIGTIPDGFVLLLDEENWYIVEVELAMHPLYEHIVPQISKFNSAIKNLITRKELIDAFYEGINNDIQLRCKFESIGIKKELYKILTDIINKNPEIIIIIDEKTDALEEVCDSLPFSTKVLEFKTYCREGVGVNVSIHLFDVLKDYYVEYTKAPFVEKKPSVKRDRYIRPSRGIKALKQILEVAELVVRKGKHYGEAVKFVASRRNIDETTVRAACTRRLSLTTNQFKELLKNEDELINFLIERFPDGEDIINLFGTLKDFYGEYTKVTAVEEKPSVKKDYHKRSSRGFEGLAQILEIAELVLQEGKDFKEAVKNVASSRKLKTETTVRDACTRRLGLKTDQFKDLLRNKDNLIKFLIEQFPERIEIIKERLR